MLYLLLGTLLLSVPVTTHAQGVTPEQIYQQVVSVNDITGAWEILPQENPLMETGNENKDSRRKLLTLRKDGTCRILDEADQVVTDGTWRLDDHELHLHPKGGAKKAYRTYFVYGIRNGFMVTRLKGAKAKDELWSRIK